MISILLVLATLSSFPSGSPSPELPKLNIIGGTVADVIPYQVSLDCNKTHICGGIIITKNVVITAAHCIHLNPGIYRIRAGTNIRGKGGQLIKVSRYIVHPSFELDTLDYDIAVLKLKKKLIFDEKVQPINMVNADEAVKPGTNAIISGWGFEREFAKKGSRKLMFATVPVVDRNTCKDDYYYYLTERMICAGDMLGTVDACNLDSGGPLVADGRLIGIISSGIGCAIEDTLGVYVNIAYLRPWIDEIVKNITCNNC